jgi:hypothetical protein
VPIPELRCPGPRVDNPALMGNFHERVPALTAVSEHADARSGFISARYGRQ